MRPVFKRTRPLLALAAAAVLALPASAEEPSLQQDCFAPDSLAARPLEKIPVKHIHTFDRPPPARPLATPEVIPTELRGSVRRVDVRGKEKLIALTFDLCEQPGEIAGYDGAIIDYLRAQGVRATFFAGGKWLRSHSERAQQLMTDPLFEIGNHSEAHRNLRLLSGARLSAEILGPQQAYETLRESLSGSQCVREHLSQFESVPQRMRLFRFPYGACSPESMLAVNGDGLIAIQWDVSTGDPSPGTSARAIAGQVLRHAKPGSIVVSHANGRGWHTAEALPLYIPKLKAAGYKFVTVSELLAAGKPVVTATCYDSRPGDTDRYDHPLGLKIGTFRTTVKRQ
jgi:peptidoglycan/xylan/chitin deacetylase (PgdA/CDA1 family)